MGGGYAIYAEIELIKLALSKGKYERFVFLQGADYPIKSAEYICDFFDRNKEVEFIRGCRCTGSKDFYFSSKARCFQFRDNLSFFKRVWNSLQYKFHIKLRRGYIVTDKKYDVFWGSAQFAITRECAEYIVNFHNTQKKFNKWFMHSFPADEMYFVTIVMNSFFKDATVNGEESCKKGLVNWRNLHYFEYGKSIRIWEKKDFEFITNLTELYIRKVNTEKSYELLNMIDKMCKF